MLITMDGKYQTRGGLKARVLCVDRKQARFPVLAALGDSEQDIFAYTNEGRRSLSAENPNDLVPVPSPPVYAPFTDADRDHVRGNWVKSKESSHEMLISGFIDGYANNSSWKNLFEKYAFLDGSPFGRLVEASDAN